MYSTPMDMWSIGCVMAELLSNEVLFSGNTESDQLKKIFKLIGVFSDDNFPGYRDVLPSTTLVRRTFSCCKAQSFKDIARPSGSCRHGT
jgi:hypothetical protein